MGDNIISDAKGRVLIMAILVEAISVVIRLETIARDIPVASINISKIARIGPFAWMTRLSG